MANLNKVMIIGNLVADPELRYTPKGTAVTDVRLAVNRIRNDEQGQRQEETTFLDVTLWARQAELAHQYLSKGRPVFIEGRLQMETWEDKASGQKRSKLKIVGENMQFLGGGGGGGGGGAPQQAQPQPAAQPEGGSAQPQGGSAVQEGGYEEEDEIPF